MISSPPGVYHLPGSTRLIADPGGTFSRANATQPAQDAPGTYTSAYALNRLVVDWQNIVPENIALAFHSVTEVQDYFGVGSVEDLEAQTFFRGYESMRGQADQPTFYVTRDPLGQRPHVLGVNLWHDTLAQLRAIQGDFEVDYFGFHYAASVDLSSVGGTLDNAINEAAKILRTDLNQHRAIAAQILGTIVPHKVTFEATIDKAQVQVTKIVSGGPLPVGAIISGNGIPGGTDSQIIHDIDGNGGPGHYSTFHSDHLPAPVIGTFTATYGVLTVTDVLSGNITNGLQLTGDGVTGLAPATGIVDLISGSGVGSTWLTNNAANVPISEPMTLKAPLLGVYMDRNGKPIVGKTQHNDFLDLSVQGEFGFDQNPSSFAGYPTGAAADALGLSQLGGAAPPEPGGQHMSLAQFMTNTLGYADQSGNPVHYGSFLSNDTRFNPQFAAWGDTPAGMAHEFLTNNRAAGVGHAITDPPGTHSGPGASTPIWNAAAVHTLAGWF